MPVISLELIGLDNGQIYYPTLQEVQNLQNTITVNILEVLSSNFPDQLGYIHHTDPSTNIDQYDIAKQAVHDAFPGYIVVAADQADYPTTNYGQSTDNAITVNADIRIVELALNEIIQDKMVRDLTDSIQTSLGAAYPTIPINVNTTMITGNVEISMPAVNINGVISAAPRDSSDVSFHEVLYGQITAATDVAGPNGTPLNLYLVDMLDNLDGLRGGAGNDTLIGSDADNNPLKGGAGNDKVFGGIGDDVIYGEDGNDLLNGGTGNDIIDAGAGNDQMLGDAGNDILDGDAGRDKLVGGTGNDIMNGGTDNDILDGGAGKDKLVGAAGHDLLNGGAGNDILVGGAGQDILTGGLGADSFDFNKTTETGLTSAARDIITDFSSDEHDKIDLSTIDANTSVAGNQTFLFIGGAAFSATNAAGQLRYDAAADLLYGSTDADNTAEFAIQLAGVLNLSTSDFVL